MARPVEKLRHFFGRTARLRRLEEEMRTHVDLLTEEGVRRGLARDEARRQAHLAFGNVLSTREETEAALGWPGLESLGLDLRIALRSLARRPAFALSLVLILALGLGVTTAIFTFVRGMLWQPLPVPNPQELYLAYDQTAAHRPFRLGAPTVHRLEADPATAGRVVAYAGNAQLALRLGDAPAEPVNAQFVSGGFFRGLQLGAARGRLLEPIDDELGRPRPVAVASWTWWQSKLGGDPAAIGRAIRLNGQEITVVGVTPPDFTGISLGSRPELWLPKGLHAGMRVQLSASTSSKGEGPKLEDWVRDDRVSWLNIMVRAGPGGTAAAQAAIDAAWQPQLATLLDNIEDAGERAEFGKRRPILAPSPQGYSSTRNGFRGAGFTLSLLVAAMLCVTVANISTLLLLRMLGRSRELGVRLALGAGRWRLARGVLLEGVLLSFGGAAAGLLLSTWLTALLGRWLAPGVPLPGVDATLLLGLALLAMILGLLLGALPAWLSARLSPQAILQQRATGGRGSLRFGRGLIVLQLAVSVLLVAVAASLALDFRRVVHADLGYARESVITTFFDVRGAGFGQEQDEAVKTRLRQAAIALPQVQAVGFAAGGALSNSTSTSGVFFRGEGVNQPKDSVQHEEIDEGYLGAMGMTLLRGRGFTADDRLGRPQAAIVSLRLARQIFGEANPVGRRFGFGPTADGDDWEIVGVVADSRVNGVREEPAPMFFLPQAQNQTPPGCLVIRVSGDAAAAREQLQKAVSAAEPTLMFSRWLTIEERVQQWMRNDLAAVRLTAGFSLLATLLAVIGVLGTLGYLVASRSREIAVRLAIGAEPGQVWRDLVREALRLGLAGAGLGLVLSLAVLSALGAKMMTGLHIDWLAITLAAVAGVLAAVVGGLLPARRAARVDPLALLKAE
ncbi:MAG: ABC transporter permease [Lacunisphaera sp.]